MEIQKTTNMVSPILKKNLEDNNINIVASTTPVISSAPIEEREQTETDSFEKQNEPEPKEKKNFLGPLIGISVALIALYMKIMSKKR